MTLGIVGQDGGPAMKVKGQPLSHPHEKRRSPLGPVVRDPLLSRARHLSDIAELLLFLPPSFRLLMMLLLLP